MISRFFPLLTGDPGILDTKLDTFVSERARFGASAVAVLRPFHDASRDGGEPLSLSATDESQGPATNFWGSFWGDRLVGEGFGGRQIASCEVGRLDVAVVGAIRPAICARALADELPVGCFSGRLLAGASD
jgi:hypothetical protein